MTDDIIDRLREPDFHDPACPFRDRCYCDDAKHDRVQDPIALEAAASIERLRRLLHKYGDRIPLATNARPDWQQEIDDAMEWVANNPDDSGVYYGR